MLLLLRLYSYAKPKFLVKFWNFYFTTYFFSFLSTEHSNFTAPFFNILKFFQKQFQFLSTFHVTVCLEMYF